MLDDLNSQLTKLYDEYMHSIYIAEMLSGLYFESMTDQIRKLKTEMIGLPKLYDIKRGIADSEELEGKISNAELVFSELFAELSQIMKKTMH